MPRRAKGPRLYLRERAGRGAVWVILDRGKEVSTHCSESDIEGSENALSAYIAEKYEPPKTNGKLSKTLSADVINLYLKEQAPKTADGGAWVGFMLSPVLDWWGLKSLADVNKTTCDEYVRSRTKAVGEQTVRHELSIFSAAIKHYHASKHGPLSAVPVVSLPSKPGTRMDYWLTRKQVADRIRAARRRHRSKHVIRLLLIGVYTGTRPGAIRTLRWVPSTAGGWFDLDSNTLHRSAIGRKVTRKRQPPARIHARLLPHLRRWRKADLEAGISYVVHYFGKPIKKVRNAWTSVAVEAGHCRPGNKFGEVIVDDGPHICRHTAATWQMQAGTDLYEAAGYLGMTPETLWEVYGHHSPHFQTSASNASGKRRAHGTPRNDMNANGTNREQKA